MSPPLPILHSSSTQSSSLFNPPYTLSFCYPPFSPPLTIRPVFHCPEITSNYTNQYVAIDGDTVMRTIIMEPETSAVLGEERTPLVMIHGFGSGLVQYYKNFDSLHAKRRLLAPDLPGFGRSTRIKFPKDSMKAEKQFVDSIEQWREKVGLEKFILLGHSLGGYLATAYTIRHPHRVRHLVLVDPWGFPSGPTDKDIQEMLSPFQNFKWRVFTNINVKPFAIIRAVGPWGERFDKMLITCCITSLVQLVHIFAGETVIQEMFPVQLILLDHFRLNSLGSSSDFST